MAENKWVNGVISVISPCLYRSYFTLLKTGSVGARRVHAIHFVSIRTAGASIFCGVFGWWPFSYPRDTFMPLETSAKLAERVRKPMRTMGHPTQKWHNYV